MVVNSKSVFYNSFIGVAGIFFTFLVVIVSPIRHICRTFVVICAKCFRPDLESLVTGMDMIFSSDFGNWDTKQDHSILLILTLDSNLAFDKVHKLFQGLITDKRNERLFKLIDPWMGYAFWKKETNFSLDQHIFTVDENKDDFKDENWLNNFTKQLLRKPFGKMLSPWEVYVVNNYQPITRKENQSLFMFRFHHVLFDGRSMIKLLSSAFDIVPKEFENPKKVSSPAKVLRRCVTVLLCPYSLLKLYLQSTDLFNTQWNNFSGDISTGQTKIHVEKLLLLKRKYANAFYPILLSGATTALRNILLGSASKIPDKIYIGLPSVKKNPPDYLCNHLGGATFPLPVGISDPVQRLVNINAEYQKFTSSKTPELTLIAADYLTSFPYRMCSKTSKVPVSGMVTILSTGALKKFLGCPLSDIKCWYPAPLPQLKAGIAIVAIINDKTVNLQGVFDKNILGSDEMANELMENINQYFDSLLEN